MTRGLVRKTAWHLDREHHMNVSEWVAMSNYRANRLVCDAADRAIQVHGGIGYSRHMPFEHIYRHHRRYRITERSEEHTSELQSLRHLVCRLLLEKKKIKTLQ